MPPASLWGVQKPGLDVESTLRDVVERIKNVVLGKHGFSGEMVVITNVDQMIKVQNC
jgi:hypothetical protein